MAVNVVVLVSPDLGNTAGLVETLSPSAVVNEDVDGGGWHVSDGVGGGPGPPLRPRYDAGTPRQLHVTRGHAWGGARIRE